MARNKGHCKNGLSKTNLQVSMKYDISKSCLVFLVSQCLSGHLPNVSTRSDDIPFIICITLGDHWQFISLCRIRLIWFIEADGTLYLYMREGQSDRKHFDENLPFSF